MSRIGKSSQVEDVRGRFRPRYYADDGGLADADNGTRPLIATFDTEATSIRRRVKQGKRD
jgi:hypothetical protein